MIDNQRDDYGCVPVAIYNFMQHAGYSPDLKYLYNILRTDETGTHPDDYEPFIKLLLKPGTELYESQDYRDFESRAFLCYTDSGGDIHMAYAYHRDHDHYVVLNSQIFDERGRHKKIFKYDELAELLRNNQHETSLFIIEDTEF